MSGALLDGWKTVRLVIHGRVQGVGYRYWALNEATAQGLDGWVRNRREGTVEVLVSGPVVAVDAMIEACRDGPPAARVIEIEAFEVNDRPEAGFRQLPTA